MASVGVADEDEDHVEEERDEEPDEVAPEAPARPANPIDRAPRVALGAFVLVAAVAVPLYLVAGNKQWFFYDDWDVLGNRRLTSVNDLFRPHFEHWITIPTVIFQLLYRVFGLRSYVPYQLVAIGAHIGVASCARAVMRRAGVGPWLATVAASVLLLFGSGNENIIWAFQIAFTLALLFGMVHLLLADHEGPIDHRDWLGLGAGLAALMCSVPGLLMVLVVGLATLLRRGWRAAAFHLGPLLAIYGLWTIVWGERSRDTPTGIPSIGTVAAFVGKGYATTVEAVGKVPGVGIVLVLVAIAGVVVSYLGVGRPRQWIVGVAGPLSLFAGGMAFELMTAVGRSSTFGADRAIESRYLYMLAILSMPLIAFAAQAVITRWPVSTPIVLLAFLIGVPGNVAAADDRSLYLLGKPAVVLAMPHVPAEKLVPNEHSVKESTANPPVRFLAAADRQGRLPPPMNLDEATINAATAAVLMEQVPEAPTNTRCSKVKGRLDHVFRLGDELVIKDPVGVTVMDGPDARSVALLPQAGQTVRMRGDKVHVVLRGPEPKTPLVICRR